MPHTQKPATDPMQHKLKAGSPSLFFLIQCLNIFFGVCALALIGLSVWLWNQFQTFTIIEIVFVALGVVQFLMSLLIMSARRSVPKLRLFLFIMMILFLAELIAVIVIAATGDGIVKEIANDSAEQIDKLKGYLDVVIYYTVGSLVIIALEMMFVKCYIGSLRERNNEFDYKFLTDDGRKLTVEEKREKDKGEISEKYNRKREELAQKYPGYQPTYS